MTWLAVLIWLDLFSGYKDDVVPRKRVGALCKLNSGFYPLLACSSYDARSYFA